MASSCILFVDDEEKSRKYFQRIFGREYNILIASQGDEAREIFQRHLHEIGLVVTDQIMPRLTGLDLLKEVEQTDPKVIRILSTAIADSELVAEAAHDGLIDYFIIKPWDIDRMKSVLDQAMTHFDHNLQGSSRLRQDLG